MSVWQVRLLPYSTQHSHCVEAASPRAALERLIGSVMPLSAVSIVDRGAGVFRVEVAGPAMRMAGDVTVTRGCPFVVGS